MKVGWKTTEFWIIVATEVGVVAAAAGGVLPEKYAAVAASVSGAGYAIARGLAKVNVPAAPPAPPANPGQ